MKKILLISLLMSLTTFTEASNFSFDIKYKCSFKKQVPDKPIVFNEYFTKGEYNDELESYNKDLTLYKKCVSKYIENINLTIDKIEKIGTSKVREAESHKYIDYVD
jgi:hypothetical protein